MLYMSQTLIAFLMRPRYLQQVLEVTRLSKILTFLSFNTIKYLAYNVYYVISFRQLWYLKHEVSQWI